MAAYETIAASWSGNIWMISEPAAIVQSCGTPSGASDAGLSCSWNDPPQPREWQALRQHLPPEWTFLASSWVAAWADSYLPAARWRPPCRFLTVRDGHRTVTGVLPIATMRFGPLAFAAAAGFPVPYRSVALDAAVMESTCAALARDLRRFTRFRMGLRIGPVSAKNRMVNALAAALRCTGWGVATRVLGRSFIVDLPGSVATFADARRGIVKRAAYHERRLRRIGEVEIRRHNALSRDCWDKVLHDAAAIEERSWIPERNGVRTFATARAQRFWLGALSDEYLSRSISIWVLYLDCRPISFSLNLDAGSTRYILANLFDAAFKIHSCGTVLAYHVLRDATETGLETVDWGQGDPGYKRDWLARPGPAVHDIIALRPGLISTLGRAALHRRSGYWF